MEKEISIKDALNIWAPQSSPQGAHLSQAQLFAFSLSGGLKGAQDKEIDHLSLCPACLDTWKTFCDINDAPAADDYSLQNDIELIGMGQLKAAAGKSIDTRKPREYKSSCGKFILSIFPEPENPQSTMITLDTTIDKTLYDNMTATIRDAKGFIFFKQPLRHGRAAAITDQLDSIDLSFWTVFLSDSSLRADHE